MHSPNLQSDPKKDEVARLAYRFRQASQIIALLVATLGVVVLCGWSFNVPSLTYIRPAFQSMKVNTALSFLLLGAGLWLVHDDKRRRIRRILGLLIVAIAGATLVEYAFHVSLGIDQLLFRDTRTPSISAYPGRMAIATAACFLLLGLAVTFSGTKKAIALQHALVTACFALSLVALCGYLYGAESLYSVTAFSTVAVHTTAGFVAACLAYFLARPDEGIVSIAASDGNSGLLLRRLIPAIIGVPILIGWLRLAGQQAHLYDTPFGVALTVLGTVGCLTALTLVIVRSMHRLEVEHFRAEEAVKDSEKRYRRIVETTNEGVWLLDSKLQTPYVNRRMAEMLGYEPQEMVGRSVFDFYFPEDVERKKEVLMRRQQGLREEREERLRRRDGSELWAQMAAIPVLKDNGEFDGALAMMSDITERKRAGEALRQSEEKFLKAFRGSPVVITLSTVKDRRFIEVNDAFERLFGYRREEVIGRTASDIGLWVDPSQREELRKRLLSEQSHRDLELRFRTKDGRVFNCLVAAELIEIGKEPCILTVASDITHRKQSEEALANMTRKLVEAQEQERARIARELHDDINQRLAMLAIELEQLQDNPSEVRTRIQELRKQTAEISNAVQALSHDLHSLQLEYLGAVAGMKSWCREFGERQKLEIDCRHDVRSTLSPEIGLCLFRVLQEALHNAAKHSGVKRIEVQLHEEAGEVHLIISDSGKGFDIEAARQGQGLGLTSMRERVRLVNGTIDIQSQPMGGTTIRVRVPLDSERGFQRLAV